MHGPGIKIKYVNYFMIQDVQSTFLFVLHFFSKLTARNRIL
jgi:hypothetical protein